MQKNRNVLSKDSIISLVIVTHNDERIVHERIIKINQVLKTIGTSYEILIIDNSSEDNTVNTLRKLHTKVPNSRTIVLSKKYDTEIALTAGLDNAIGDYVVLFNIYTDPPAIIGQFIDKLISGYDIVIGKCSFLSRKSQLLSAFLLRLVSNISRQDFYYHQNQLFAINRKAVNSVTKIKRKNRSFSYINYLIGFRKIFIVYKPVKKYKGKIEEENFFRISLKIADMIISNSFKPIRVLSLLGVILSLLYLFYVFVIVILAIFINSKIVPQGWISTSTVMSVMFFLIFSLLAIISEYLIRILNETRNEPPYFISEEIDRSSILPKPRKLNVVRP